MTSTSPRGGATASGAFPFPTTSVDDVTTRLLQESSAEQTDVAGARSAEELDEEAELSPSPEGSDIAWNGMTALDETLEKIGVGWYQKCLLVLCGFGWLADNMWLQCIAVILPRVQQHFDISNQWIGILSSSIFTGMMLGAWGWGSYSDAKGRSPAFHLTLCVTSVFGLLSAAAPTFPLLCLGLFGLGTGVGGSMPTDGTLFLENIPKTHHFLLTALSAFFSVGAVLTSMLGLFILPAHSCPESSKATCDVSTQNQGWRYMLATLGGVSIIMALLRVALFRLQESAKFLVSAGRPREAIIALQRISKMNGDPMDWELADVYDAPPASASPPASAAILYGTPSPGTALSIGGGTSPTLRGREEFSDGIVRKPMAGTMVEYRARIDELFEPKWALTTKLVWVIWFFASAGYTIFNVFLPKFLEGKAVATPGGGGLTESLREYVLYTISGVPGSFIGAYLIETRLGRRGTMAISTIVTTLSTFSFVLVSTQTGVVASMMACNISATLMYAVIYSYTPEVFPPGLRGTAGGIASALSRLGGIMAPILTGVLLSINTSLPLYVSALFCAITAAAMILLPIETRGGPKVAMGGH
ncbi:MFS transporter [Pseudohyphozyma bogoriensis]|nr:MFS transporter [Pseudohyphozyma bogoriensis]